MHFVFLRQPQLDTFPGGERHYELALGNPDVVVCLSLIPALLLARPTISLEGWARLGVIAAAWEKSKKKKVLTIPITKGCCCIFGGFGFVFFVFGDTLRRLNCVGKAIEHNDVRYKVHYHAGMESWIFRASCLMQIESRWLRLFVRV